MKEKLSNHPNLCDLNVLESIQKNAVQNAQDIFAQRPKLGDNDGKTNLEGIKKYCQVGNKKRKT